ncbi:MAG: TonB-dependent receptor plug domain-containing protein [bacterium]|nr:TonB-dependent receptor plug domain-containing protein [bacterium]
MKRLAIVTIFFAVSMGSLVVNAAPGEELAEEAFFRMEQEIVVSASNKEQPLTEAPANIYVISGEELRNRGCRTLYDLMSDLPGVTWSRGFGYASNGTPVIRGSYDQKRLKVMLNGMTIDPKDGSGTYWSDRFPIEGVDRVEFIIGPYASLYGRNTFSGVINIITKSGEEFNGAQANFLYGEYHRLQGTALFGTKIGGFDIYSSFFRNYSERGINWAEEYPEYYSLEYRQSQGAVFPEGVSTEVIGPWDSWEIYFKCSHEMGIQFDIQVNQAASPKVGSVLSPVNYASPKEAISKQDLINTRLLYDVKAGDRFSSTTAVQFQDNRWKGKNYYLTADTSLQRKWYASKSMSFLFDEKARLRIFDWNEIYLGVALEYVRENEVIYTFEDAEPSWNDDQVHGEKILTLTLQNEMVFFKRFYIVLGLMYERSNMYDHVFIPRFSTMFKITDSSIIKFLYGAGFLPPDPVVGVDQVVPAGTSVQGKRSGIKPEYVHSFDLQFIQNFTKNFRLQTSLYYIYVKDRIQQVDDNSLPAPFIQTWTNIGTTESKGIDTYFEGSIWDTVKLFVSYSFVYGSYDKVNADRTITTQNRLPVSAKHHFKAGMNILLIGKRLNLYIHDLFIGDRSTFHDDQYGSLQFAAPGYKLEGYNLIDINLSTTPNLLKNFFFSVGVKNLLDTKGYDVFYRDSHLVYYPPILRRTWTAQAGYKYTF